MAKEINLRELYIILKKRFWIVIIITFIAGIAGYFQNSTHTTLLYQTSSRIIVGANADYMNTLRVIMRDTIIMEKVIEELDLKKSPERLAGQITVDSIDNSQVVRITVVDTDPVLAADIANTTATIFKNEIGNIVNFNDVSYLSEAKINPYPINSQSNKTFYVSIVMGLVFGTGFIFLLNSLDDKVRSDRDIEELVGIPVLGSVSKMNRKNINKHKHKHLEIESRGEDVNA
ncbi:YveK family protein [Alkalihalobacterium chitinilyticum]|uniref:Capsular biosynthesis protein n=1 Tax=Alkalihalobacterium chitinilyticum TaxID=2980103 RepID=A0ABT5VEL5_9BACI|nr:capsular biosynthesis protein [Alkalihalobacterium chitinilyticum]MDE5413777.1 capsular biosynthesis protein [Alkalihalobacterium chitinilyticum]